MSEKITWKKNYGDGELTDDSVLWVKGKPTNNVVSPVSGYYSAMMGKREVGIADTKKECKEMILERLGLN